MTKTYSVKQIKDIRTGDVLKSARRTVTNVEFSVPDAKLVTLTFANGCKGQFFGTQRLGIYR
jgi:hypothetical protein